MYVFAHLHAYTHTHTCMQTDIGFTPMHIDLYVYIYMHMEIDTAHPPHPALYIHSPLEFMPRQYALLPRSRSTRRAMLPCMYSHTYIHVHTHKYIHTARGFTPICMDIYIYIWRSTLLTGPILSPPVSFLFSPLEFMPPTIRSASSEPFHAPCCAAMYV